MNDPPGKRDHEVLKAVFDVLKLETGIEEGRIEVVASLPQDSKEKAMVEFRKLVEEGWLCTAESQKIHFHHNGSGQNWPPPADSCPIEGEGISSEKQSVHLRYTGQGWLIQKLRRVESSPNKPGLVTTESLIAHDGKRVLCYEVGWELERIGTHDEWRACRYRFLGFGEIEVRSGYRDIESQPIVQSASKT
jgi:hypothetical protein